jgi:SH3-like domain-containing protein
MIDCSLAPSRPGSVPLFLSALLLLALLMPGGSGLAAPNPAPAPAPAPTAAQPGAPKIPRFVTLRSDKVNVRSGPGARYSIDWVFERRGLPVEVVAEYEFWRKVRDIEGTEGWVHQNLLSPRRAVIVVGPVRDLKNDARADAADVARLEPDVIGQLLECKGDWCRLDAEGYRGWLKRDEVWGLLPGDTGE